MSLVSQIASFVTRVATEFNSLRSEVTSALSGKADSVHGHAISDVTSLQTTLDGKANLSGATFSGNISTVDLFATEAYLTNTTAASTTSTTHPLQLGSTTTGTRMKMGPNTIQVVTSTSSTTTLEVQPNGGLTRFGGPVDTDVAQTTTAGAAAMRNIRLSTANPSGGIDGDVWLKYS